MKTLLWILSVLPSQPSAVAFPVLGTPLENLGEHTGAIETRCRCFPGDSCWPLPEEWNELNRTLGGNLVATIPIASVCHDNPFMIPYDAEACAQLRSVWNHPETHYVTSSSPMAPFFANMSCDPFTTRESQCVIGSYVQYAVNASTVDCFRKTVAFVQRHNIRLVVRNTGHDYLGKSTGAGALAIWTYHMKDINIQDYESPTYMGKAMKLGAGVMNFEAQEAAHSHGLVVVGGDCQSVGLAGGYTQGGGHGPLASTFGLSADQVLEFDVLTSTGKYLKATPTENEDLYWALSGGGGGTYGLVFSLTVKAYPDMKTAAANLTFSRQGVSSEAFNAAVQRFLTTLPSITDSGVVCIWLLTNTSFTLSPASAPNMSSEQLQALLQPTLESLSENGISYDYFIQDFPSYLESYNMMHPKYNITEASIGGRLIPRSLVSSSISTISLINAIEFIVESGGQVSGVSINVTRPPDVPNSVHPAWRSALFSAVVSITYDPFNFEANIASQEKITTVFVPKLAELTPDGAAYLNEADPHQPDFQQVFYGANYERLLAVKHKYDPNGMFYGQTAVGSEAWQIKLDGRLCRTD